MVAFTKIQPGNILWDCHRQQMGNTTMRRMTCWMVQVFEVDTEKRRAMCSWNGNSAKWWSERQIEKLRRTPIKEKR